MLKKNKKIHKKIHKKKPFNKDKVLLVCGMFLIILMLIMSYVYITLMILGFGIGIQWATDIAKETTRSTVQTVLNIIMSIFGFLVGRHHRSIEDKKNKEETED